MANCVRIGVDVGGELTTPLTTRTETTDQLTRVSGTNTDAVVLDPAQAASPGRGVLASQKVPTTEDTTQGIEQALRAVLDKSGVPVSRIGSVTIGTTAFLNAVIQRDRRLLSRVAVIRLSKSFLRDVPPFSGWPKSLADAISSYVGYVDGGLHIDGTEESPLAEEQVAVHCGKIRELGIKAVVIAGVYSPIDVDYHQEDRVRQVLIRSLPGVDVVCSQEVANIGFLERENAAILNAAILRHARRTIRSFRVAVKGLGLSSCPLYLTQNDGTMLDATAAARLPIRTFSSGVTNSMRGAAYLSGYGRDSEAEKPAVVVDIGGTTTDVGVLLPSGLPRQASAYVSIAGVKVNYSMPQIHSIGLGGGSIIERGDTGLVQVGPRSIGHALDKSLVFGGQVTTATDVAVASGQATVGDGSFVENIDTQLLSDAKAQIGKLLEEAIDAVKTSPEPILVFMTGGGSVIAPDNIQGASNVIKPPFFDCCNAVGAACSGVGATIDTIHSLGQQNIKDATEALKQQAIDLAEAAGASRETAQIVKVDMIPIPYLDNQVRAVITAIGDLDLARAQSQAVPDDEFEDHNDKEIMLPTTPVLDTSDVRVEHKSYRPWIAPSHKGVQEWHISSIDLDYIADGCYVLGCGGGGHPDPGRMQLQHMLEAGHTIRVVDASSLEDDSSVYWGGRMGSPAAINERLQAHETVLAIRALMEHLRQDSFDAVMGLEIGGSNGLEPFLWGSSRFFDRPVIDADFMGRANPMCWQTTLTVHRPGEFVPCAIDSGDGQTMLMTRAQRDEAVDRPLRGALVEMGSLVGLAGRPTTAGVARQHGVRNTVSLAWRIGRAIALAEESVSISQAADRIVREVGGEGSAKILFRGKISAVERTLRKGHSIGVLHIAHAGVDEANDGITTDVATGGTLRVPFINENILAEHEAENGTKTMLATVPDLIALLDTQTGRAVGVPEYRYGCHVTVLVIACSPRWTETQRGIDIGGPKGYGYDVEYQPIGRYVEPRSVIEEYGTG